MFKGIGKWFDSLWEGNPNHVEYKSTLSKMVDDREIRVLCTYNIIDNIKLNLVNHKYLKVQKTTGNVVRNYIVIQFDDSVQDTLCFVLDTSFDLSVRRTFWLSNDTSISVNESVSKYVITVYELDPNLVVVEKEKLRKLFAKAKPHTVPYYRDLMAVAEYEDRVRVITLDNIDAVVVSYEILAILRKEIKETEYKGYKYVITNHNLVDRKLLGHTMARRWVNIEELDSAENDWTFRFLPADQARGCARYFKLSIEFDATGLERVVFDLPIMLRGAVEPFVKQLVNELKPRIEKKIDSWINYDPPHYHMEFNINNLRIKHKAVDLVVKHWIKRQNEHPEFCDSNPVFNVLCTSDTVGGCWFGFDKNNEFYYYHNKDVIDKKHPYGRHTPE